MDPTPPKQASLASHTGAARFAYNWGLALVTTRLEQRAAGGDVEVPWTLPELRREWNRAKQQIAPWWRMNSKEAYSSGLDALARKHVQLPRIGVVKTHESTRKLARRLEQGTARILAASISRTANRWFVSFTVEVQRQVPASNARTSVVGVDVGVRYLAVLSTGQIIPNPRPLEDRCTGCGGSPAPSAIPARPSCAANSPTRPPGTAAGWSWRTGSSHRPRRARRVGGVRAKLTLAERTFAARPAWCGSTGT